MSDLTCGCGDTRHPVHGLKTDGQWQMTGWYCHTCKNFMKAIGRERRLPIKPPTRVLKND